MICSKTTFTKLAVSVAALAVVVALAMPSSRSWLLASSPLLLILLCPLFMIFCMRHMRGGNAEGKANADAVRRQADSVHDRRDR